MGMVWMVFGTRADRLQAAIAVVVQEIDQWILRPLNNEFDNNGARAEVQLEVLTRSLSDQPEMLYAIIALSNEVTSHSFHPFFDALSKAVAPVYRGKFDFLRYAEDHFKGSFLVDFMFTLTIFGRLEAVIKDVGYKPSFFADKLLSTANRSIFLDKPVLFAKIVNSIVQFKDSSLTNAFLRKLTELANTDAQLSLMLKLLVEFDMLASVPPAIQALVADIQLPDTDPVWRGPQQHWVDADGSISVGLFWSTEKEGEARHYAEFPKIFGNGKSVNNFYRNYTGYVDRSDDPAYQLKILKHGAKGVLVKRFPKTGRSIEIYLYSSLQAIKQSRHAVTVSRGHSGERGNTDYPGISGGARLVSHCRSVNASDTLINANPDSSIIAIIGTGAAVETNPTLYYMLEYLGRKKTFGSWKKVKDYIAPHIPRSILKYTFPLDDIGFIYGVILKKIKMMEAPPQASRIRYSRVAELAAVGRLITQSQ